MHERQNLGAQLVEQEARADVSVIRLLLHQRAGGHDARERKLVLADAVVKIAFGFSENRRGIDAVEIGAGFLNDERQAINIERHARAIAQRHMQLRLGRYLDRLGGGLFSALALTFVTIKHIGAGDLVMLAAHQREFDLILHILDVEGAPLADPARQRAHHFVRQLLDHLVNAP